MLLVVFLLIGVLLCTNGFETVPANTAVLRTYTRETLLSAEPPCSRHQRPRWGKQTEEEGKERWRQTTRPQTGKQAPAAFVHLEQCTFAP